MKLEVKEVNDVQRELQFEIPSERIAQSMDEAYKNIGKKAKIKGFRPGKVPRKILEENYTADARDEVLRKLVPKVYHEGIEQEKLEPIAMPDIDDVSFKEDTITFKATVDIKPDIKIDGYKGIKVKRKSTEVTEEEINKTLDYFKASAGEGKEVDDNFAKSMGYPSLEDFKKSLVKQLEVDKDKHNRADIENQVAEALLKKVKFTVPKSLVKNEIEHRISHQKEQWNKQGMATDEMQKKEESLRVELQEPTERNVKVFLTLNKIAELEKIEIKENDNVYFKVMEFLLKEAKWEG
ncbi:Cell division trigger factor [hydrothermal vent metagenome]|uniref:peptidylprolyl isomerase n=1 Tax=hydrothermal vent metagenome TaxID=652676 RepID=A0A3B1D3W4_9ZZZZ